MSAAPSANPPDPAVSSAPAAPTTTWSHVLSKVLRQPANGAVQQALAINDIQDVETLYSLKDTDIESLTYPVSGDGGLINMAPLTLGSRVLLCAFRDYMGELRCKDN